GFEIRSSASGGLSKERPASDEAIDRRENEGETTPFGFVRSHRAIVSETGGPPQRGRTLCSWATAFRSVDTRDNPKHGRSGSASPGRSASASRSLRRRASA